MNVVGKRVVHKKFGEGKITSLTEPEKIANTIMSVEFESVNGEPVEKKFLLFNRSGYLEFDKFFTTSDPNLKKYFKFLEKEAIELTQMLDKARGAYTTKWQESFIWSSLVVLLVFIYSVYHFSNYYKSAICIWIFAGRKTD